MTLSLTAWTRTPEIYHLYVQLLRDMILDAPTQRVRIADGRVPYPAQLIDGQGCYEKALSMIGALRLDNFRAALEHVAVHRVVGDIVECGVWRGGACCFARGILNAIAISDPEATSRLVFAFDSFQGVPPPDPKHYPADVGDTLHSLEWLSVSQRHVRDNFVRLGMLDDLPSEAAETCARDRERGVVFVPGFFKDSMTPSRLAIAGLDQIAVLRLDGDLYESTTQIFDALYDRVAVGGVIIVDDYVHGPCRKAVHDFRDRRNIIGPILSIDWTGHWWIKEN